MRANREAVVKQYVAFSIQAAFPYNDPAPHHICWYIEQLAERSLVSTTISNDISALRTYFGMARLDKAPLFAPQVAHALRGVSITIRHTPNRCS